MSPRPRVLSDSAILEAAIQVVSKTGPERFTLADVGEAVGLSAATLVQRFGSKRSMLLAMFQQSITLIDDRFAATVTTHGSPIDALYVAAIERYRTIEAPGAMSNRLAFLMLQLTDPEFHAIAAESASKAIIGYKTMLESAIATGELLDPSIDTQQLAETIHAMTLGSLVMWSVMRDGTRATQMEHHLDTLLRPFMREPRKHPLFEETLPFTEGIVPGQEPPAPVPAAN